MKARDRACPNAINSLTGIRAMKREIWRLLHPALKLCAVVSVIAVGSVVVGCGDGGGGGSEDTGSLVIIVGGSTGNESVDVDVAPDDLNSDGVIDTSDNLIKTFTEQFSFTNVSVVPEKNTATRLRLVGCTVGYEPVSGTTTIPALDSADCKSLPLEIDPDATVDYTVEVVPIEVINEVNPGLSPSFFDIFVYNATISFEFESVPFGESMTRTIHIPLRMFNGAPKSTSSTPSTP